MKIKEICEKTGLTDRTVRYYIEEGLISPFYIESYLGRKSFDFSEQDLEGLKNIATLRAYGFTVEEIKELITGDGECREIVEAVKQRTAQTLDESKRRMDVLSTLAPPEKVELSQLAKNLESPKLSAENESINPKKGKRFLLLLKACIMFIAVWLPIALVVSVLGYNFYKLDTPLLQPTFFICAISCILPSMLTLLLFGKLGGKRKILRLILVPLCLVCLPLGTYFSSKSVIVCNHSYREYRTVAVATCHTGGEKIMKCRTCGDLKTEEIEQLSHVLKTVRGVDPTCVDEGLSDGIVCSLCDDVLVAQTAVPKTEHTPVTDEAVAATCKSTGLTEGSHCSVCQTTLVKQTVISATAHSHIMTEIKESCGRDGCLLYECACGDTYKKNIVRATNLHSFQQKSSGIGYCCSTCGLEVITHGTVDGSSPDKSDQIKFYITGTEKFSLRTMVIYGNGVMPDFIDGYDPKWINDYLKYEVRTIIIERGVISIGDYAFFAPFYSSVDELIIRSKHIRYDDHNYSFAGINIIRTKIIYDY